MNRSTQKKISPPIRFATIVAASAPSASSQTSTTARSGVESCQRAR
jgi:hypothetical protein